MARLLGVQSTLSRSRVFTGMRWPAGPHRRAVASPSHTHTRFSMHRDMVWLPTGWGRPPTRSTVHARQSTKTMLSVHSRRSATAAYVSSDRKEIPGHGANGCDGRFRRSDGGRKPRLHQLLDSIPASLLQRASFSTYRAHADGQCPPGCVDRRSLRTTPWSEPVDGDGGHCFCSRACVSPHESVWLYRHGSNRHGAVFFFFALQDLRPCR